MNDLEFPDYAPVYPIRKKVQPKQKRTLIPSNWGNEQVKTVGQNQTAPEWEVKWILYDDDANTIDSFLATRARYNQSFLWSPPGYPQNRYRCDSWSKSLVDVFVSEVNATFKRIYDYDNLITISLANGHYGIGSQLLSFGFGKFIQPETSYFGTPIDDLAADGQFDNLSLIDSIGITGFINFGRTYILYSDVYQVSITGGDANFMKGLASDYFASMDQQVYGWDRDFQVDWWGD